MKKELLTTIVIIIGLAILKFFFHEFWKDEWQAWLVARDMSLTQMLGFLNYEGHPSLWYLYLIPFTWLSSYFKEDVLLNLAHLLPIIVCVYLLFFKTTLPFLYKTMMALSYFLFFEYGVVNRGYVFVILFTLLAAIAMKESKINLLAISLFMLCQTEIYGVLLAATLCVYWYFEQGVKNYKPYIWAFAGFLLFVTTVYPRGNADDFTRAYNQSIFSSTTLLNSLQGLLANTFTIGFIPDTASYGFTGVGVILSIIILIIITYIFYAQKSIRYTWLFGFFALLLFSILIFTGGVRQWGFMYLLFITLLILNPYIYLDKIKYWLVAALLLPPILHNIKAIKKDVQINFSNAKDAGEFIKTKIPNNVAIVSLNKFETAGAAAYANRKLFELPSGNAFTYFKWLERIYVPTQSELMLFAKYKGAKGLIVVSPSPIDAKRFPILKLWQKFDKENFKSEEYYFYTMDLSGRN